MHIHVKAILISPYLPGPELGNEGSEDLASWDGRLIRCCKIHRVCLIIILSLRLIRVLSIKTQIQIRFLCLMFINLDAL